MIHNSKDISGEQNMTFLSNKKNPESVPQIERLEKLSFGSIGNLLKIWLTIEKKFNFRKR